MEFNSWDAGLHTVDNDYFQHFGAKGMKWGTRKYQNEDGSLTPLGRQHYGVNGDRTARGVSRDLRRLEKERAGAEARADYYHNRSVRKIKKAQLKAKKTGEKVKLSKKTQKFIAKEKAYKNLTNKASDMSKKILRNALAKGYSVTSRDTMRFVRKGKDKGLILLGRKGTSVNSVKYHVRDDGLGVRKHKKTIGAINRARHQSNFIFGPSYRRS